MLTNQAACDPVSDGGLAMVPAKFMLGSVPMQVLPADDVEHPDNRPLEQTEKAFGGVHVRSKATLIAGVFAARVVDRDVVAHLAPKPSVGAEFVGRPPRSSAANSIGFDVPRPRTPGGAPLRTLRRLPPM